MNYLETGAKHVAEMIKFLKRLEFKDVNGGSEFIIGGKQVDACAGHEGTLIIIECTTQKDITSKLNSFRGKINDIVHGFKCHKSYKSYKRYKYVLAVKYQKVTDTHLKNALESKGKKVYIWDNKLISYYSSIQHSIGKYAKYNLLAEIEVTPESDEHVTIPAFSTRVGPKGRHILFLFFVEHSDLLKIAYVARRELGFESYYH